MDILTEFEELKPIVQEKWLDFYEKYSILLDKFATAGVKNSSRYENADSILLILISIEPKLSAKMLNLKKFTEQMNINFPDSHKWLEILEISLFTNDLDQKIEERKKAQDISPPSLLDDIRQQHQQNKP